MAWDDMSAGRAAAERRRQEAERAREREERRRRNERRERREERRNREEGRRSQAANNSRSSSRGRTWQQILFGGRGVVIGNRDYRSSSSRRSGWHTGEDIGVAGGSASARINIPMGGTVVSAGWGAGGGSAFGNAVLVRLNNGDYMFFAHLSTIGVRKGQKLKPGNFIGTVGNTGNSYGAHLHLEIRTRASGGSFGNRESWRFTDPIAYLNRHASDVSASGGGGGGGGGRGGGRGGGGGGVGSNGRGFSRREFYADLEAMFGDLDTLLALDRQSMKETGGKSIQWAIDKAVRERITDPDRFATLLNQTAWFKRYGRETTQRLVLEKSKPGVFRTERNEIRAEIAQYAANLGVRLSDAALNSIARDAYIYGWGAQSASVIDRLQKKASGYTGGVIGETVEEMEQFARAFGVNLSSDDIRQLRADVLEGYGDQRVRDRLQKRAAEKYSVFAKDIEEGVSLRSLIQPYLQLTAELLELSPDSIDMDDRLFRQGKAFQTTDESSGKIVQRTLADFERMVRKDPRWRTTDNARQTSMEMTSGILQQMGLI